MRWILNPMVSSILRDIFESTYSKYIVVYYETEEFILNSSLELLFVEVK